jgi:hypothetical protein
MVVGIEESDGGTKNRTSEELEGISKAISEEAKSNLEAIWNQIYNDAIGLCPVDTGALVSSIKLETDEEVSEAVNGVSFTMSGSGEKAVSIFNGTITAGDESIINEKNKLPTIVYASFVHDGHFSNGRYIEGTYFLTDAVDLHMADLEQAIDEALKSVGGE